MNTTFKVIFNKARCALMVTNEVTSCVQSKGTKTVLASACTMALIGLSDGAFATVAGHDTDDSSVQGYSVVWDSETLPDNTIKITLNKALEDEIHQAAPSKTVESYGLMIKDGATGALENADIVSTTDFPEGSLDQSMNVALGIKGGDVTLKGATTHISATSSLEGRDANNRVTALLVDGGSLNLAADKTEISATSNNKTGKVAYGIKTGGGRVMSFPGLFPGMPVMMSGGGRLMGSGDLNVTAISQDKNAYALYGEKNSSITFLGNTTLTAKTNAPNTHAYAVYLDSGAELYLWGGENILNGDVEVHADAHGRLRGMLHLVGNTVINGNLSGSGWIENTGPLTISGTLSGFSGHFGMRDANLSLTKENGYFDVHTAQVHFANSLVDIRNTELTDFGHTYFDRKSTLLTNGKRAFGVAADATDLTGLASKYQGVNFTEGNFTFDDEKYNLGWVKKAQELVYTRGSPFGRPWLLLAGTLVDANGAEVKMIKTADIVEHTIMPRVHYDATDGTVIDGVQSLDTTVGVQSVFLSKEATKAQLQRQQMTLVGSENGGELISAGGKSVEFDVINSFLSLGNKYVSNTRGSISNKVSMDHGHINVWGGSFHIEHVVLSDAYMTVQGNLTVNTLSGKTYGQVFIGGSSRPVKMTVNSFDLDAQDVEVSSYRQKPIRPTLDSMDSLAIKSFKDNTVKSNFVARPGSLVSFGDATTAAAESLLMNSGVTLGNKAGEISSALYIDASNGPLTLAKGVVLDGNNSSFALQPNTLAIQPNSMLLIDAAKVKSSVFGDQTTVSFEAGSEAFLDNVTKDGLLLTGEGGSITLADDVTIRTNDRMLKPGKVSDGKIEINVVDNKEDAQMTDQGVFEAIKTVYDAGRNDPNATHQADAFATRVAQGEKYFGSMAVANKVATEMRALATMAGVQSTSWDSASLFNDRIQARQSLANLGAKGTGLWADLYASRNKSESFGGGAGYESDIHGGIFGADTTLQNGLTVGAALTYAKADTDTTGTLAKIKNKSDFVGLSAYGSMPLDRANVIADVTYLYGDHDVKANANGTWGDTVKTNLFALGVRTEWLSTYAGVNVMPHVGLRFTTLETDGYEAAFDMAKTRQNIVTLPVGLTLSADLTAGDWTVKPMADFSVIPAIGDRDVKVAYGAKQKLAVDVIEGGLFNMTLGLAAHEGAWTIGVNYRLGMAGNNRSNNTLNANMSYAF